MRYLRIAYIWIKHISFFPSFRCYVSFVGDSALRARGSTNITYHISLVATRTVHFACTPLLIHFYVIYFVEPLRLYLEVFLFALASPFRARPACGFALSLGSALGSGFGPS